MAYRWKTGMRGKQSRLPKLVVTYGEMGSDNLDAASRGRCYPVMRMPSRAGLLALPFGRGGGVEGVREGREPFPHAVHLLAVRFRRVIRVRHATRVAPTLGARRFAVAVGHQAEAKALISGRIEVGWKD